MMTKQLDLTADQQVKVKTILTDERTQMMALRDDTSTAQADKREKFMGLMKTENEKIKAVLNEDQKKKFVEMEEKQRERMREQRGNGGPPPPPPAA